LRIYGGAPNFTNNKSILESQPIVGEVYSVRHKFDMIIIATAKEGSKETNFEFEYQVQGAEMNWID
jgi:hypothetical protein